MCRMFTILPLKADDAKTVRIPFLWPVSLPNKYKLLLVCCIIPIWIHRLNKRSYIITTAEDTDSLAYACCHFDLSNLVTACCYVLTYGVSISNVGRVLCEDYFKSYTKVNCSVNRMSETYKASLQFSLYI